MECLLSKRYYTCFGGQIVFRDLLDFQIRIAQGFFHQIIDYFY